MTTNEFIKLLAKHRSELTKAQIKTLRGQAIKGDVAGAMKGLQKILQKGIGHDGGKVPEVWDREVTQPRDTD